MGDVVGTERKKAPKGSVRLEEVEGRLRLRWSHLGKRYTLPVGAANRINRSAGERLATKIELDIASGNFDSSLTKYKAPTSSETGLDWRDLYHKFVTHKSKLVELQSLNKYKVIQRLLETFLGNKKNQPIDEVLGQKFVDWLVQKRKLKAETVNAYLTLLREVWDWGISKKRVQENPWRGLEDHRKDSKKPPQPFTQKEIQRIIGGFEGSYYLDFVKFLLEVGCRPGEACGLLWDAVSEDCSEVWIGRSYSNRELKGTTKNNKTRTVPVSLSAQKMLLSRRPENPAPDALVFPGPEGAYIDVRNFLKRHWKPTLEAVGVPYRSIYHCRHTRWSHEISSGMDEATAAKYAGNTPRTMIDRYFGSVRRPRLSSLTEED